MTYEEVKEISRRVSRVNCLGKQVEDIRLDNETILIQKRPEFWYYKLEMYEGVTLIINEHQDDGGILLYKTYDENFDSDKKEKQEEIYNICQNIVRDYLSGNLVKGEWYERMKNLYIIYDWRDREVLYSSYNETKAYAYIGQLVAKEEYDEDMHMIKFQLDEVEEWNLKNELEKLWLK